MNSYFSTLDAIVQKRKISNRIRFMIEDVVDLRKRRREPHREDSNPKTIDQIHREIQEERKEQELERKLNNPTPRRRTKGSRKFLLSLLFNAVKICYNADKFR